MPNDTSTLPRTTKNAKKNPKHSAIPKIAPTSTSMMTATLERLYQKLFLSVFGRFAPMGESTFSRRFLMRFFI